MKFEIRKKLEAKSSRMSAVDYDILIDGKEVEPKWLTNIEINAEAGGFPTVCLTYSHVELDIELDGIDLNKRSD